MPVSILTLDLKGARVVAAYRKHHAAVWPEVLRSLRRVGVKDMQIFALGRRLVMILETRPGFDPARDFARHRASDPRCAEWEKLMAAYQQPAPGAPPRTLWAPMEKVFSLRDQLDRLRKGGRMTSKVKGRRSR